MALNLPNAGGKAPAVSVLVHGSVPVVRVQYLKILHVPEIPAGDVPAMLCVLRLKGDSVAPGCDDREVFPVERIDFLLRNHRLYLLSWDSAGLGAFAVVY